MRSGLACKITAVVGFAIDIRKRADKSNTVIPELMQRVRQRVFEHLPLRVLLESFDAHAGEPAPLR